MIESHIGQHLKDYQPRRNLHRLVNEFLHSPRYAFPPSAIITQEKKFPDASFYQGAINWDAMRSRTDAVILRGGQGTYSDIQFSRNWTVSKRVGVKRGIYWFYDDRYSPGAQAEKLAGLIRDDLPEMEIWIDWEVVYGGAFGGLRNVVAMMERVEQLLPGVRVGLYTGYYFFIEHSNAITNAAQYHYLKTRPLWLGWYTSSAALVRIPSPWASLLLWQFGTPAEGGLYGVETVEIDMNYFNGTQTDFNSRYGGASEPPPTGDLMEQWQITWDAGARLRTGPSINNTGGAILPDNAIINVQQVQVNTPGVEEWAQHENGQWFATIYNSQPRAVRLGVPPPSDDGDKVEIFVNGVLKYTVTGALVIS